MRHILGTVVDVQWLTSTANGNPRADVTIEHVDGTRDTYRTSSGARIGHTIADPAYADSAHGFSLTDAGRIIDEDTSATSAHNRLTRDFPRGATVHTTISHVSSSGMSRRIKALAVDVRGDIQDVSGPVAYLLGWKRHRQGGVVVQGAGMDMGFHLVYTLARRLYGDGYALSQRWV